MLPVILVAVGAYLIGDSVLEDKKYDKGGMSDGGEKAAKKRLEELRKELRAETISYGELAELESLKKYIDDDDVELRQAAGIPEYEDEEDDDDDDKYAKGGKLEVGDMVMVDDSGYAKYFSGFDVSKPAKITSKNKGKSFGKVKYFYGLETADGKKPFNQAIESMLTKVSKDGGMMAKGGKVRSQEEFNELVIEKEKLVKNLSPKEIAEMWNKNSNSPSKMTDNEAKNSTSKMYLRDLLVEKELSKAEHNKYFEKGGYMADGGVMDVVNTEVIKVKGNIMGTTSLELKIKGMRKPQDFIVYPISNDQAGKPITIQSDTRFGYLDLSSGRGLMSQSHANGAYSYHFSMDKKVPFKISETDVQKIKEHLASKASSKAGNSVIFSDNSGADKMAKGGKVGIKEYKIYPMKPTGVKGMITADYDNMETFVGTEDEAVARAKEMANSNPNFVRVEVKLRLKTKTNTVGIVDGQNKQYAKGGKLVGKQKNLDVNKNGKLDAEDFKMLRGEKMDDGGYMTDDGDLAIGKVVKVQVGSKLKPRWVKGKIDMIYDTRLVVNHNGKLYSVDKSDYNNKERIKF